MPLGFGMELIGDWGKAVQAMGVLEKRVKIALDRAAAKEAHFLRAKLVEGMRKQAPGDEPYTPLKATTLAIRKFIGFDGSKALIHRGDLLKAITVQRVGTTGGVGIYFVGVLAQAKSSDGEPLVDIARVQEEGAGPFVVPITAKSRAFFHAALRAAGIASPRGTGTEGGGAAIAIVRIPPRPTFAPVFKKYAVSAQIKARFYAAIAIELFGSDFSLAWMGQIGAGLFSGSAGGKQKPVPKPKKPKKGPPERDPKTGRYRKRGA